MTAVKVNKGDVKKDKMERDSTGNAKDFNSTQQKRESGLYRNPREDSFEDTSKIKRNMIDRGELPVSDTPLPEKKGLDYWSDRFEARQEQFNEVAEIATNHVEFTFPKSICLNFIGDLHVGSPNVDYKRIREEAAYIVNTPDSYVMLMGDLIEGFFFNPAQMEQMEQVPEQYNYMRELLKFYAEAERLLIGWTGDHDHSWSKKMGISAYADFSEFTGAHLMSGVGYATLKVGEQEYKVAGCHRFPGSSIYNPTHPGKRSLIFGGTRGSDIVVTGHTHKKSHSQDSLTGFGGKAEDVHIINVGPYKWNDGYARKLGLTPIANSTGQMYGSAVILDGKEKDIHYYNDIIQANKKFTERYE